MFLARMTLLAMTGCVIHTDEDPFDRGDLDDTNLQVDPPQVGTGTTALEIQDHAFEADFEELYDVRPLGDFEVVEWSSFDDHVSLVVEIPQGVTGQHTLGLDFPDGTVYATFEVY